MLGFKLQADKLVQLFNTIQSPIWFIFAGVILAPFVEETFFRGFLFAGFRQRYGWNKAALFSSAFFAIVHLQLAVLVPTFLIGYVASYLYQKSNSIWPGIIMHFLINAFGISVTLLMTRLKGFTPL